MIAYLYFESLILEPRTRLYRPTGLTRFQERLFNATTEVKVKAGSKGESSSMICLWTMENGESDWCGHQADPVCPSLIESVVASSNLTIVGSGVVAGAV